jgi:hypothetical protein
MLPAFPLRTTLLPSYPRNLNRTHSLISSSRIFIQVDDHSSFALSLPFPVLFSARSHPYSCPLIRPSFAKDALLLAGFLLALLYIWLVHFLAGNEV